MPVHVFTTLDAPSATNSFAEGINTAGEIVGFYKTATSTNSFLLSGGTYTTLADPLATNDTEASAINNAGQIVGAYVNGSGHHGFLLSGGTYTIPRRSLGHHRHRCRGHQRSRPDRGNL